MARTNGFENYEKRFVHYTEHGKDFGTGTIAEYRANADDFLTEPRRASVVECNRNAGTASVTTRQPRIRHPVADGLIRTYFKPIPARGYRLDLIHHIVHGHIGTLLSSVGV